MKRFEKNFVILCDEAFLGEAGKVSIIGIFERIFADKMPAVHLKSVLVGNFNVNDNKTSEANVKIDLVDIEGNTVGLSIPNIKLNIPLSSSKIRRVGFIYALGNLKFEKYGVYKFLVTIDSEIVGEYMFEVQKPTVQK